MPALDPITSTRNPRVRQLVALGRARERRESGQHLAEGPNAVHAAIAAGLAEEVFVGPEVPVSELPDDLVVTPVSAPVLARLTDATTPQGLVARVRTPRTRLAEVVGRGLLVVLDTVADPGNAGTILRTADAVGATGVVLTRGSVDAFSPKAIRSAAGSTYHLPVVTDVTLPEVVAACHANGQHVLGLDGAATTDVAALEASSGPLALVLGNEAHGLSDATRGELDGLVAIPIRGGAESLNVAAAAAIAIYLAARGLDAGAGGSTGAAVTGS